MIATLSVHDRIRLSPNLGAFTGEITAIDGNTVKFIYLCDPKVYETTIDKLKQDAPAGYWLLDSTEIKRLNT